MSIHDFDLAVIGGGIAGTSTAARLQTQNHSTVVLEQTIDGDTFRWEGGTQ